MNKNKKVKNEKFKIVLKLIINIFCYVCTGITLLFFIIYSCVSCSTMYDQANTTVNNDRSNKNQNINLRYSDNVPINMASFGQHLFEYRSTESTSLTNIIMFNNPYWHLYVVDLDKISQSYNFTVSNNSNSKIVIFKGGNDYRSFDYFFNVSSISFIKAATNYFSITHNGPGQPNPQYTVSNLASGYKYFIIAQYSYGASSLVLNSIDFVNIDNYYRNLTYVGQTSDDCSTFNATKWNEVYNYFSVNRYENFYDIDYSKKYIFNPYYDFSDYEFVTKIESYDCDSRTIQYDDYSESVLTRSFRFDEDNNAVAFYNGYSNNNYISGYFNNIIQPYTRFDVTYWNYAPYSNGDSSPVVWEVYNRIYVFTFSELIPIQNGVNNFDEMFLSIDDNGLIQYGGQFQVNFRNLYNTYLLIFPQANQTLALNFRYNSNLYFNNTEWKSIVVMQYNHFLSAMSGMYLSLYDHTVSSMLGNGQPIFEQKLNDVLQRNEWFNVSFSTIQVSDFLFFVSCPIQNLNLIPNYVPSTNGGITTPATILGGVANVFDLMTFAFRGIAGLLAIEISPGLVIGAFAFLPFAVTVLFTMIWLFKR